MGDGGCDELCPAAMGLSLVILFSLFVSVKDWLLHWVLGRSQTYYPEHIHVYGCRKTYCSLVMGSGPFRTD